MSKLKTFFRSLYLSGTNPSYYRDLLHAKFSFSVKYFFMLTLLLSIISTIVLSLILTPQIKALKLQLTSNSLADKIYPDDLVITLKNGKLSTNRKEPVVITLPFDNRVNTKNLVIDPSASISAMEKYQAGVFINENSVSFTGDNNKIRTYLLKDTEDFTLNKNEVSKIFATAGKILNTLTYFLPGILLFFSFFFYVILLIVKIFFYSFITHIAARLLSFTLPFKKAFQLTIHAITPIVFLQILETAFGIQIPIPFFFPILYIVLIVIIVKELKNKPAVNNK